MVENWPVNATIIRVRATDADLGVDGEVHYRILPAETGETCACFIFYALLSDAFRVHNQTGYLVPARPLHGMARQKPYELVIEALDGFSA